jgi:Flp pilus assembly protein TadD
MLLRGEARHNSSACSRYKKGIWPPLEAPSKRFCGCNRKARRRTIRLAGCCSDRMKSIAGDLHATPQEAREAARMAPGDSETHRTVGRVLDLSGDLDGAFSEIRPAMDLEPQHAELHDDLGSVLVQKADPQDAAAEFSEALRLQPNFAQAHLHLGILRYQSGVLEEACSFFHPLYALTIVKSRFTQLFYCTLSQFVLHFYDSAP